jgi:ribose-phosphate pyrophosphokinase
MIDTAGTITEATRALVDQGAQAVYAICTHPVLSGPAIERLSGANIKQVLVVNTIPLNGKEKVCKKIKVLSIASLLGEAIKRIHKEGSVSCLFD